MLDTFCCFRKASSAAVAVTAIVLALGVPQTGEGSHSDRRGGKGDPHAKNNGLDIRRLVSEAPAITLFSHRPTEQLIQIGKLFKKHVGDKTTVSAAIGLPEKTSPKLRRSAIHAFGNRDLRTILQLQYTAPEKISKKISGDVPTLVQENLSVMNTKPHGGKAALVVFHDTTLSPQSKSPGPLRHGKSPLHAFAKEIMAIDAADRPQCLVIHDKNNPPKAQDLPKGMHIISSDAFFEAFGASDPPAPPQKTTPRKKPTKRAAVPHEVPPLPSLESLITALTGITSTEQQSIRSAANDAATTGMNVFQQSLLAASKRLNKFLPAGSPLKNNKRLALALTAFMATYASEGLLDKENGTYVSLEQFSNQLTELVSSLGKNAISEFHKLLGRTQPSHSSDGTDHPAAEHSHKKRRPQTNGDHENDGAARRDMAAMRNLGNELDGLATIARRTNEENRVNTEIESVNTTLQGTLSAKMVDKRHIPELATQFMEVIEALNHNNHDASQAVTVAKMAQSFMEKFDIHSADVGKANISRAYLKEMTEHAGQDSALLKFIEEQTIGAQKAE